MPMLLRHHVIQKLFFQHRTLPLGGLGVVFRACVDLDLPFLYRLYMYAIDSKSSCRSLAS